MTAMIVLWVVLGTPAGYVSARMYKVRREENQPEGESVTNGCVPSPGRSALIFFTVHR